MDSKEMAQCYSKKNEARVRAKKEQYSFKCWGYLLNIYSLFFNPYVYSFPHVPVELHMQQKS